MTSRNYAYQTAPRWGINVLRTTQRCTSGTPPRTFNAHSKYWSWFAPLLASLSIRTIQVPSRSVTAPGSGNGARTKASCGWPQAHSQSTWGFCLAIHCLEKLNARLSYNKSKKSSRSGRTDDSRSQLESSFPTKWSLGASSIWRHVATFSREFSLCGKTPPTSIPQWRNLRGRWQEPKHRTQLKVPKLVNQRDPPSRELVGSNTTTLCPRLGTTTQDQIAFYWHNIYPSKGCHWMGLKPNNPPSIADWTTKGRNATVFQLTGHTSTRWTSAQYQQAEALTSSQWRLPTRTSF